MSAETSGSANNPTDRIRNMVDAPRGVQDLTREVKIARIVHEMRTGADFTEDNRDIKPKVGSAESAEIYRAWFKEFGNL